MMKMIRELYGSFEVTRKVDYGFNVMKGLYILYSLPFLLLGSLYYVVTLSNFDESMKLSGIGKVGKISIHVLANIVSLIFYAYFYRILTGELELPN